MWTDGGPAHFRNAEALVNNVHLQQLLRILSGNPFARLIWNFMMAYHGKGPYDAEGGLVKYFVRREIRFMQRSFLTVKDVFEFVSNCLKLLCPDQPTGPGASNHQLEAFFINERKCHMVICGDVAFDNTLMEYQAAKVDKRLYKGPTNGIHKVYSLTFDDMPSVIETTLPDGVLGVPAPLFVGPLVQGAPVPAAVPYAPATLNVSGRVHFGGKWAGLSCICRRCLQADTSFACSSLGTSSARTRAPRVWAPFTVRAAPSKVRAGPWAASALANLSAEHLTGKDAMITEVARDLIATLPGVYTLLTPATKYVATIFAEEEWAVLWVKKLTAGRHVPANQVEHEASNFAKFMDGVTWRPARGTSQAFFTALLTRMRENST